MSGWIGVDLDGTLARYDGWRGIDHIGEPMPRTSAAIAGTDRQPYHAPSPKEDAPCRNLSAGSPVSSA